MKKIKLPLLIITFIALSCSREDLTNDNTSNFNVQEMYESIINNSNNNETNYKTAANETGIDMAKYESLSNEQKATLWGYKYDLFEKQSSLNEKQQEIVAEIKEFSEKSIINQDYNKTEALILDLKIQGNFTLNQYFDLMFYLDTPSTFGMTPEAPSNLCFWCYEITKVVTPCRVEEYNGHYHVVKTVEIKKRRFFIGWGTDEVDIPCTDDEIYDLFF